MYLVFLQTSFCYSGPWQGKEGAWKIELEVIKFGQVQNSFFLLHTACGMQWTILTSFNHGKLFQVFRFDSLLYHLLQL